MLERIVLAIITALLNYIGKKNEKAKTPLEGDRRPDSLLLIGHRVREWEDRLDSRRQSDESGTKHSGEGVSED